MDDTKLKFLPRHLQRSQPAGSSRSKRRVTVENEDGGDDESDRRKPSVFERLGPGASQRTEKTNVCVEYQEHGICPYGKVCPYSHSLKSKGHLKRDEKEAPDDLRLKFKGQSGKDREGKVKSQVVVRKAGGDSDDESGEDSDNWSIDKLASKKEMELERKRQEIQRALSALEATEEVDDHKKRSESSESESSPERPAKKKKEKASKKEKRKKHKKSALEKEKVKESKRKLDSDEEDSSQKNQKKRKKKKQKHAADIPAATTKSSKLLTPLKKVLKQKKGSEAAAATKRSKSRRSESVGSSSRQRGRSSGQDSSSESSPSPSPAKRKKTLVPERSQDRLMKKRSRSSEKKRYTDRRGDRRSVSSSSSSSSPSSSSPSPSRGRSSAAKIRKLESGKDFSHKGRQARAEAPHQDRKEKREKKKRDKSSESWTASKSSSVDRAAKGRQVMGQPEKLRGMREREERLNTAASMGKRGKKATRDTSKGGRHEGKEGKDMASAGRGGGSRGEWGDKDGSGRKEKRRGETGRENEEERIRAQKNNRETRENRGSLERQDRMRRAGGFGSGHSYSQQNSQHGGQRASDNDNRHYDDPSGPYTSEVTRGNQYQNDRQRRSDRGDAYDRRDAMDSRNDRGPGRFNRGNDNGDGRGWDDRRHGGEGYGRDDWGGRDRPPSHFGTDDDPRDFGRRIDDRRKGREDRLLPHFGDAELPKDSRFSQVGDARNQRGGGGHREDFARDRPGIRDWKLREGSHDSSSRRDLGDAADKRPSSRDRQRGGASRLANDTSRERPDGKDTEKIKRDVPSKISSPGMLGLKSQPVKEDSPITRDEPSLASLFSQTETVAPVKKKTTKSFGGKKSPKKSAEDTKQEKGKSGLASRLGGHSKRAPEKKSGLAVAKPREEKSEDKTKDVDKPDKSKDKVVKAQSPKGSHKSEDSPRSRHSQTRSSRRTSKSPDSKRQASTRSPAPAKGSDTAKSDSRKSLSPAPSSSRDRDKKEASQRSPATSSTRDRRRRDDSKRTEEQPKSQAERVKKRDRSKSHSSEEESHVSPDDKKRRRSSDSDSVPAKLEGGDGDIAAAMLGDGIDDGQQEERVFSDWSDDDDADNILMGGDSRKLQPRMMMQVHDFDHLSRGIMDLGRGLRRPLHPPSRLMDREIRPKPEMRIEPLKEKPVLEKNIPNVKIVEDIQKEKPARERRRRDAENEGYEEISSDENDLDEEGEKMNKRTIVSILDIDLTSLMPSAKQKPVSGPVFMRYKAANVFAELGISRRFAGDSLFKEVKETCQRQLEEMATEQDDQAEPIQSADSVSNNVVKEEAAEPVPSSESTKAPQMAVYESMTEPILSPPDTPSGSNDFEQTENEKPKPEAIPANLPDSHPPSVKTENIQTEPTEKQKPLFELYSDSCAIHRFTKLRVRERSGLFNNAAMLSRALTARRDLDIRRRLCKIPQNYDQSAIYPSGVVDHDLHQMCSQIFKQNRPLTLSKSLTASC